uniref:BZIP domain-containing protein n=1 Tax=Tetradesmus obliquus TaxID=3088 RepID=A0A383VIW8_TETOB|eukprot:jgi/Sobl393_1/17222/SZX65151.1
MGGNGASTLSVEQQLQQLLEPGKGSFAPFPGYQAPSQQQMPPFTTSRLVAAPGISPFSHLGPNLLAQQQQQAAFASSSQHAAAAALAVPRTSSNTDTRNNLTLTPEEQQHLLELLLAPQHQQRMVPQPSGMQPQSCLQPYQQHSCESSPLMLPHELQQLQQALQPKQEPSHFTYQQQQQHQQPYATPQRNQHQQVTTAQQVLAAADAAAAATAARRPASKRQPPKQAGTKRPAAKQLQQPQQPQQAAKAVFPASSEDDMAAAAGPKKRGRPPLNPGKYSRGYLAIKAYRQRKKGMVEGMEADIAAMQEQVMQLEAEHAALQLKHQVLQAAIASSDEVLSQMASLQLHTPTAVTSSTSSSTGSLGASCEAAAAALDSALAAVQGASSAAAHPGDANWAAVLARVEYELQRGATLSQQQAQQRSHTAAIAAAGRYKAYVSGTAEHLAQGLLPSNAAQQQQRSASPASPAANSSSSGFAAFPLAIGDLLQLAQLQRGLQEPAGGPSCSHSVLLNLENGASVEVGRDFWENVAQQVPAPASPQQQQQLEALMEVYSAALGRLAQDRQQLAETLAAGSAGSGVEGGAGLAAAAEAYAARACAMTLSYEWALQGLLSNEQVAKMCMACWPYLPVVGAVVSSMLGQ